MVIGCGKNMRVTSR